MQGSIIINLPTRAPINVSLKQPVTAIPVLTPFDILDMCQRNQRPSISYLTLGRGM